MDILLNGQCYLDVADFSLSLNKFYYVYNNVSVFVS